MTKTDGDQLDFGDAVAAKCIANPSTALPESKYADSGNLDSGYASQSSTPDSSKSTIVERSGTWSRTFRKPKLLRPYNKPIPQLTSDRFSDLREQYAEQLNTFTRSLPNCPSVLMTLQVLGEDEESAKPWVFVQCDKSVHKQISNFFRQPFIKRDFEPSNPDARSPRLQVLVCALPPRPLMEHVHPPSTQSTRGPVTDEKISRVYAEGWTMPADFLYGTKILCGLPPHARNAILSGRLSQARKATMGGLIVLVDKQGGKKVLGMTAGHVFLEQLPDIIDDEHLDDDTFEEECFELDLSVVQPTAEPEVKVDTVEPTAEQLEEEVHLMKLVNIGELLEASHTSPSVDPNRDWGLISIADVQLDNFWKISAVRKMLRRSVNVVFDGTDESVLMLSGRRVIPGNLSTSWSYIMLKPGKVMVRAWLLSLKAGEILEAGDSGSWVVDPSGFQVYGHVVASDVFGRGYVIPIRDSFTDIQVRLSADSVSFVSARDIEEHNMKDELSQLRRPKSPRPGGDPYRASNDSGYASIPDEDIIIEDELDDWNMDIELSEDGDWAYDEETFGNDATIRLEIPVPKHETLEPDLQAEMADLERQNKLTMEQVRAEHERRRMETKKPNAPKADDSEPRRYLTESLETKRQRVETEMHDSMRTDSPGVTILSTSMARTSMPRTSMPRTSMARTSMPRISMDRISMPRSMEHADSFWSQEMSEEEE